MRWLLASLLFSLCGCASCPTPSALCGPANETRCNGTKAEVCAPNSQWMLLMDCTTLGSGWACARTPEGHTCIKIP